MKSTVSEILPLRVRRSLAKLGGDINLARRKRGLTVQMMAERIGVAKSAYLRLEKGDPSVALGAYAMTFFVLGFDEVLGDILDVRSDDQGLLLDQQRIPRRIRPPKAIRPL